MGGGIPSTLHIIGREVSDRLGWTDALENFIAAKFHDVSNPADVQRDRIHALRAKFLRRRQAIRTEVILISLCSCVDG